MGNPNYIGLASEMILVTVPKSWARATYQHQLGQKGMISKKHVQNATTGSDLNQFDRKTLQDNIFKCGLVSMEGFEDELVYETED